MNVKRLAVIGLTAGALVAGGATLASGPREDPANFTAVVDL